MSIKEIKDLIKFISESNLNEVTVETDQIKLSIKRSFDTTGSSSTYIPTLQPLVLTSNQQPVSIRNQQESGSESNIFKIKAPMIGTFYSSANPDSPPFVSIGDKIVKGQKLCIIEAMKLFNEIESDVSGILIEILVENASPVEYDQGLFIIEPIDR
jgi:acetyl-CoA carboxylase biotin carboxyl carrier protein